MYDLDYLLFHKKNKYLLKEKELLGHILILLSLQKTFTMFSFTKTYKNGLY